MWSPGFASWRKCCCDVNYLLLKLFTVLMSRQDAAVAVGMFCNMEFQLL